MATSLNKVLLIGRVAGDPNIRVTNAGARMATLSLATTREWTDRAGQKQRSTQLHRLHFSDKLAGLVERQANKGTLVYIEGSIDYTEIEDGNGSITNVTAIRVSEMLMCGGQAD